MSPVSFYAGRPPVLALGTGDLPTWIGAIGTVLGVIAAAVAAYFVYGQLAELRKQAKQQQKVSDDHERELDDVRKIQAKQLELFNLEIADRHGSQARQVKVARSVMSWGSDQGISNGFSFALTINNESHAPISNVMAKYPNQPNADDGERAEYFYVLTNGSLAPGPNGAITDEWLRSIRFPVPAQMLEQGRAVMITAAPRGEDAVKLLTGIVRFTDAEQRHWHIDEVGVLSEINDRDW